MLDVSLSIEQKIRKLGNRSVAAQSARFFKTGKGEYGEGDLFLGIRVPVIRKLVKKYQNLNCTDISELMKSPYHEIRLFSVLALVDKFAKGDEKMQKQIFQLYLKNLSFVNNWDIVDSSASYIVGAYLIDKDRSQLYSLANSKILWRRRVAIMATFHFIKNNQFNDCLKLCEVLLDDKEDLIHKATGWMLREIGNRSLETEEIFLKKYYHKMPRTMLRYAIEKFPEKKRKAYLNGTI
jgi:3-methyladenine DNA glycosylase AlkD